MKQTETLPNKVILQQSCILVVDDNPTILHLLNKTLEKEGFTTLTATNGIEAMQQLAKHIDTIDVILLDRIMPEMDGIEVTRKIMNDHKLRHIPIIMQTSADKPEEISEGIKAGVFYYLTKPIERKTLLSVVSAAIKEIKQRKILRAEMQRHKMSFGLIEVMKSSCRDLYEAENLSSFLANCFPDPERALTGISELLINAVEHGNLDISYEEKTKLVEENRWKDEVSRRLKDPVNNNKNVTVIFEKKGEAYYLQVTDQGKGFNWQEYLELDPSRASDNHGRGVAMANMIAFDRLVYNEKGNQVTGIMKIKSSDQETDDYWG